jgi:serine/threonine-protein kinase RsbW
MIVLRSFDARPAVLREIRMYVREQASGAGLPTELTDDLVLAVSEACTNAVLHSGSDQLHVGFNQDHGCVEFEIRDEGVFNRRIPMPEFEGTQGHGIPLMIALMDEVSIREGTKRRGGTRVRLRKCRDS